MDREFIFTWRIKSNDRVFTREKDKTFDKVLNFRPFVFTVINQKTNQEYNFFISKKQEPIFFRRVFCKCGLGSMFNKVCKIAYAFGYEESKEKFIMWECEDKFYFINDIDKLMK